MKSNCQEKAEIAKCYDEIKNLEDSNTGLEELIKKNTQEKIGKTLELDRLTEEKKDFRGGSSLIS